MCACVSVWACNLQQNFCDADLVFYLEEPLGLLCRFCVCVEELDVLLLSLLPLGNLLWRYVAVSLVQVKAYALH